MYTRALFTSTMSSSFREAGQSPLTSSNETRRWDETRSIGQQRGPMTLTPASSQGLAALASSQFWRKQTGTSLDHFSPRYMASIEPCLHFTFFAHIPSLAGSQRSLSSAKCRFSLLFPLLNRTPSATLNENPTSSVLSPTHRPLLIAGPFQDA